MNNEDKVIYAHERQRILSELKNENTKPSIGPEEAAIYPPKEKIIHTKEKIKEIIDEGTYIILFENNEKLECFTNNLSIPAAIGAMCIFIQKLQNSVDG